MTDFNGVLELSVGAECWNRLLEQTFRTASGIVLTLWGGEKVIDFL